MNTKIIFLLVICSLVLSKAAANNIAVTNVGLGNQNTTANTSVISFDLSWENSWRISSGPANYDAAWVFAKYRTSGGTWQHARLTAGGVAPSGVMVDRYDDVGAFVYRSADGSGNLSLTGVQLVWDYGVDAVDDGAVVDIQVFAIEMVFVPGGSFWVGTPFLDRNNMVGEFSTFTSQISQRVPYRVTSEAAITVANTSGNLFYFNNEGAPLNIGDELGPIPAAFPKGFAAFYCMKYEVSQEQWVAFFNTLTPAQQANLDVTSGSGKNTDITTGGNGISWPDIGNATTSIPNGALNFVATVMTMAYLDWAGLRHMTELEFEKACRGPLAPVGSELAWGSANLAITSYVFINDGTANELISNQPTGTGNAILSGLGATSPKRVGINAASAANPTREESGGTYYGIMDMTGNVYERAITVGNPAGRAFTGLHGDGTITATGSANVTGWPSNQIGIGYRGGSFSNTARFGFVSDRFDASTALTNGNSRLGFRGVRTAQ